MRRLLMLLLVAASIGILLRGEVPCDAFQLQPACYVTLNPGPTRDALGLVAVEGAATFGSTGELVVTTVTIDQTLSPAEWVRTAFSSRVSQVPRTVVFPAGESVQQVVDRNVADMDLSQVAATVAALRELGYEVDEQPDGAEVVSVAPGSPAEGQLAPEDVIVRVDGRDVRTADEVSDLIGHHAAGDRVAVSVAGDPVRDLEIEVRDDPERAGWGDVGIITRTYVDLPVEVHIDAGDIGGPSAGLIFSVAIVDLLSEEDLTGGRVIAGTGSINADGSVGDIGGVRQKVIGATERPEARPATVFLVPMTQQGSTFAEARSTAVNAEILLVPVADLHSAVVALRELNAGRTPVDALALAPAS